MERLSISSFLKNGHPFHLYVYEAVKGIPEGVTIKDASDVLPTDKIFISFGALLINNQLNENRKSKIL